jgi:RNA polymerase-binding transcription factor DksA
MSVVVDRPGRAAAPDPDGWGPDALAALRDALQRERRFRVEQLADLAIAPPAQDPALTEVHAIMLTGARRALADIDAALQAMREGRYGRCGSCHGPIPRDVLRAIPRTRLCGACQAAGDAGTR